MVLKGVFMILFWTRKRDCNRPYLAIQQPQFHIQINRSSFSSLAMSLRNPNDLILRNVGIIEREFSVTYKEPVMGIKQHINVAFVSFGFVEPGGTAPFRIVDRSQIGDDVIMLYSELQKIIGTCTAHAERINDEFFHINKYSLGKTEEELSQPGCKDFMALKNNIIRYVKVDADT